MSPMRLESSCHWYAVHTHPKQEERAASNLQAWQVEIFAPWRRGRRQGSPSPSGWTTYAHQPLFPGYIFAHFDVQESLHKIRYTRGVHSIVSFGLTPAVVDDELILFIQARRAEDGCTRMSGDWQLGDELVIKEGLFKGFVGIFERQMKDSDRVMLLLKAVAHKSHVVVEPEHLEKVGDQYNFACQTA